MRSSPLKRSGMDHTVLGCKVHHTCLYVVKHLPDGATTDNDNSRLIAAYYSFIDPERIRGEVLTTMRYTNRCLPYLTREDERLSWPIWLAYSGRFTHINGYPSAAGPMHARGSSPVRDRRSTTDDTANRMCY